MPNLTIITASIGIIQSLIFGSLILFKSGKRASDWILLIWFLLFASHLGLILLIDWSGFRTVLILAKTFTLLLGPLLLLYTFSVFNRHFLSRWLVHLVPFLSLTLFSFFLSNPRFVNGWEVFLLVSKTLSLIGYPIFVLLWLRKRLSFLKTTRADNFILDSSWVKMLSILMLTYAGLGVTHVLTNVLLEVQFSIILDILFYVVMIMIIGFYGLKFGIVFNPNLPTVPESTKTMYKNSPLKRDEIVAMRVKIDDFFAETDEYLQADFSLARLSELLEIKKHHLSEIINLDMGTTFYDIVNAKRVQRARELLVAGRDDHITLEALGYECGFNTKSAFYHHFKNFTGKTPGQFKKEISPD